LIKQPRALEQVITLSLPFFVVAGCNAAGTSMVGTIGFLARFNDRMPLATMTQATMKGDT